MIADPVPTGNAVRYGWDKMKERLGFWIVLEIIVGAISYIPSWLSTNLQRESPALPALFSLIGAVLSIIIGIGVLGIALKIYDGQVPTYGDLFSRRHLFFRYLGGVLLYAIIVAIGSMLLVIPGIIFALTYLFTAYLIVDRGLGVRDALRTSARLTGGVKWGLLGFSLVLAGINVLGVIALGVGVLITVPVTLMATVYMYRHRLMQAGAAPTVPQPVPAG